jgi:hypothetical protein
MIFLVSIKEKFVHGLNATGNIENSVELTPEEIELLKKNTVFRHRINFLD